MRSSILACAPAASISNAQPYWQSITPAEAGFNTAKLETLQRDLAAHKTSAFLVIRRGKIAYEWYAPGNGPEKRQGTASLAKALVGGLSLLIAMNDGRIAPDDLAVKYIPAWKDDPLKARITIRQLATHTSGVEDAEQDNLPHDKLPGWKGAFWRRDPNPFSIAVHQAPIVFAPRTSYAYSNPGMAALSYAVTASLRGSATPDIHSLLEQRIMRPLGIPDSAWSIGYGRAYETDGLNLYANWGGAAFTPRAAAKLAMLMLQRGEWAHSQLLSRPLIEQALTYAGTPLPHGPLDASAPASGLCWWINTNGGWEGVPKDAFACAGAGHQIVLVVPSLDLVVVRNGQALDLPDRSHGYWSPAVQHLLRPVVEAIADKNAYPASRVIRGVHFAPPANIVRQAIGSDNWPITWAGDNSQYAAYGDGKGFEPYTNQKLSLGFARIQGSSTHFRGVNIRSASGERTGDGPKGLKASGMLMVDGVLYLWVRNAHNAQLAWSPDRGKTWQWGFRFESGFGAPSFLNFGKNYRGARDEYVYTYSQDGPSAYESDDSLLLARVRKSRLRDRSAWEFLERLDPNGNPVWSADIRQRGEVFRYPRHCRRVDAVYDPALKRYLLAVAYNQESGWGIYDAPEPWGPWTTAFHTGHWDLDHTHGYRLPAKWIERNGRAMALIFSGLTPYDAFCVRRMILDVP
jgi:CubicO group peptidase (beta-lactamase class C family)